MVQQHDGIPTKDKLSKFAEIGIELFIEMIDTNCTIVNE